MSSVELAQPIHETAKLGLALAEDRVAHPVAPAHPGRRDPTSCSYKIATICSLLNLARFIRPAPLAGRTLLKSRGSLRAETLPDRAS